MAPALPPGTGAAYIRRPVAPGPTQPAVMTVFVL